MRRPSPSPSSVAAAKAFRRWCVPSVMQALYHFATTALGLPAIDAKVKGDPEAVEVIDTMFELGLGGLLKCDLPEGATEKQVVFYLSKRLRWMSATSFRRRVRTVGVEALDEIPDETPDVIERISGFRLAEDCRRALEHDAEATAFLEQLREDLTRADIAEALGWSVQRAKVVRNRIARVLAAREAAMNHNGEDGPQRSVPRGDFHAPTAEERGGAPPEPDRGTGGARRRR